MWPETDVGETVNLLCPVNTTSGSVTRMCASAGVWAEPDTSACVNVSNAVNELTNMVNLHVISVILVLYDGFS
jgi:hypothetical protein